MSDEKSFDRKILEYALAELGQRAFSAGRTVEIVIFSNIGIDPDDETPTSSSAPTAFRRRLLFASKDALSRPRM